MKAKFKNEVYEMGVEVCDECGKPFEYMILEGHIDDMASEGLDLEVCVKCAGFVFYMAYLVGAGE